MEVVIQSLIEIATAVLVAAAVPLVGYGVVYLRNLAAKANVNLSAATEERLKQVAMDGIALAAERAHQYAKEHVITKLPSSDRLRIATEHVLATIPGVTRAEAADAIHAVLPHVRQAIDAGTESVGNAIRTPAPPAGQ
jgi:hypothetical protein